MDLREICQFLGGSSFGDEYRGDFQQIAASISLEENPDRPPQALELKAAFLLRKAAFCTISGNINAARAALDSLASFDYALHEGWALRRRCYQNFNLLHQLNPPAIRFRSDFGSFSSIIRDAKLGHLSPAQHPPRRDLQDLDQVELSLPLHIYQYDLFLWAKQCQHPDYPWKELSDNASVFISRLRTPFPSEVTQLLASSSDLGFLYSSYRRMEHESEVASTIGMESLGYEQLSQHFDTLGDLTGKALCLISQADRILCPPFSSPVALNLVIRGPLTGWIDDIWDFEEPKFCLRDNDDSKTLYDKALELMESAKAPRGIAAIHLRRACVDHIAGVIAFHQNRQHDAKEIFVRAERGFENALKGFMWDEANTQLVRCHLILLDITRGTISDVTSRAAQIGKWGSDTHSGNSYLAQFMGLLMMRYGRRQYLDYSQTARAKISISCAQECFKALGDTVFMLQANLAEAELQQASGNTAEAVYSMKEKAPQALWAALEHLQALGNKSTSIKDSLRGPLVNMLIYFDLAATRIYSAAPDQTLLLGWNKQYLDLSRDIEMNAFFDLPILPSGPTEGGSQSSGQGTGQVPFNMRAMHQELADAQELARLYSLADMESYTALEDADIDQYEQRLRDFLSSTSSLRAPKDQLAVFRIIAYSRLGRNREASQELRDAVPRLLGGVEENSIESQLRRVNLGGLTIDNSKQIDANQAERAISLCFLCRDWKTGSQILETVSRSIPGYLDVGRATARGLNWMIGTWIGHIYEYNKDFERALSWYIWALGSMQTRRATNPDSDGQSGSQSSIHGAELFAGLIRVSLLISEDRTGSHDRQAMESHRVNQAFKFLEQSYAQTLLEFLMNQDVPSHSPATPESTRSRYLRRQIIDLSTAARPQHVGAARDYDSLQKDLEKFKEEFQKLQTQESTFSPITKALMGSVPSTVDSQVFEKIAPGTVVIEINMSRGGIILFCITRTGFVSTHQSGTSVIDIRRHILRYVRCLRNKQTDQQSFDTLNHLSSQLSEEFLRPFDHIIQDHDHVVFVPSQESIIFPLSALMYNGAPLFLSKAVSQLPSLSILAKLHRKSPSRSHMNLSAIFNTRSAEPPVSASTLTLPSTPPRNAPSHPLEQLTQQREGPVFTNAITATLSSALAGASPDCASSLSPSDFAQQYTGSDIVLVCTDSTTSPPSPWQSCIPLKTDFRVIDVSQLTSRASLVIFGGCLSGLGRVYNGNDLLGFSHAILQSGVSNYLSALWNVSDYVSMLLIVSFFRKLALREGGVTLAKCWQHAQKTVYGLADDMGKAAVMLKGMKGEWEAIGAATAAEMEGKETPEARKEREKLLRQGSRAVDKVIEDLTNSNLPKQDFRHPFFWASYVMVGDGDVVLNADAEVLDDDDFSWEDRTPSEQLLSRIVEKMEDILTTHAFPEDLYPVAIDLDNSLLELKHWACDIKVNDGVLPLVEERHPFLANTERFILKSISTHLRKLKRLLSGDVPVNQVHFILPVVTRLKRSINALTDQVGPYTDILDLHKERGPVTTLRKELQRTEKKLIGQKTESKPVGDLKGAQFHLKSTLHPEPTSAIPHQVLGSSPASNNQSDAAKATDTDRNLMVVNETSLKLQENSAIFLRLLAKEARVWRACTVTIRC